MMNRAISYILRAFFHQLYHSWAWTYDLVASIVSVGLWTRWVQAALPFVQGPRVLEIGHGPGHLQVSLIQQGWEAIGIDESRQMGRFALRRIRRTLDPSKKPFGYAHKPELAQSFAQALPFSPAVFNSVVATFPSSFIFEAATLESIHRVLCPGGMLVVVLSGWITGRNPLLRLAALLFRVTGESQEPLIDLQTLFSSFGFLVESRWLDLGTSRILLILAQKP